jgi:hypothetical protein
VENLATKELLFKEIESELTCEAMRASEAVFFATGWSQDAMSVL